MSASVVIVIFLVDVAVLWMLSRIGGRLKADVKATISKFGGSLAISSAGLVGCFLAIASFALAAIYVIARLLGS